jgi:putative ABC transport system permease protein
MEVAKMNKWIKIAFRNIIKNKRRSIVTLSAIALGFAAVSLFYGYIHFVFQGIRTSAIRGEGLGHLTIYKKGWLEQGKIDPEKYMLTEQEVKKVIQTVEAEEGVDLGTPQLFISGMVTNGKISTIFLAKGVIPEHDKTIKGAQASFRPVHGTPISSKKEWAVEMAKDLAKHLSLKQKDTAVVMAATLDGQMNALDVEVSGIYDTGSSATNDKFIRIPFSYAQSLYDTKKADRVVVLLDDWKNTWTMKDKLQEKLSAAGVGVEIKTWEELSMFYRQVRGMFSMIFMFIFFIVLVIVVMSVVNTMGMAVVERTREIGTLRALGLKRRGVNLLFALEGSILGFLGSMGGIVLFLMVWGIFQITQPSYIPPSSSSPVPLLIDIVPQMIVGLVAFLSALSLLAAIIPARKAGKQNVVDALGHV